MAVIVSSVPHTLVNHPPVQTSSIDIALTASSTPDFDYNTPRAIAHGIDLVAAVVGLPTSASDPTGAPPSEYRLVNKRKNDDGDDEVPFGHVAKKVKPDDPNPSRESSLLNEQPPFLDPPPPSASQTEALNVTIEEALAAILSLPSFQACTQQLPPSPPPSFIEEPILPPSDLQPATPDAPPSLLPPEVPAPAQDSQPELFFVPVNDEDAEGEDDEEYPISFRKSTLRVGLSRSPVIPPLWKVACRTRVDHIINVYGMPAIRDNVMKKSRSLTFPEPSWPEAGPSCIPLPPSLSGEVTQQALESPIIPAPNPALELEICTPLDFNPPTSLNKHLTINTTLGPAPENSQESLQDNAFDADLESDTDSDGDLDMDLDAEGESDTEFDDEEVTSPHESLLSFPPFSVPSMSHFLPPIDPALSQLPLPQISTIPAFCLRGYGGVDQDWRGTPRRVPDEARGTLSELREARMQRMCERARMMQQNRC